MAGSSASIPACVMRKAGESLFRIQWGLVISQAHQIFRGTEYPISNKEFPTDQIFVYLPWILDIPCWLLDIVLRDKHPDDGAAIAEKTGIFRGNRIRIQSCNRNGQGRRLTGYDEANSEQHIGGYLSLARA
jgi:hypothetical protein